MEPATRILAILGGPSKVAARLGLHRTRVSNWKRPKDRGGSGGRIPQNHHRALLEYAREQGVEISAEDLLPASASSSSRAADTPPPE